jgi:hypothetical protein
VEAQAGQQLQIINVDDFRRAINRPGIVAVNLSAPGSTHPMIVEVALDDVETLILQDRLPNPLRKTAVEAAEYYEEAQAEAEEIDPKTGERKGFDPEKLKVSLEFIDHLIASVQYNPPYKLMKDVGRGAVPEGYLCLKDYGDYERAACARLVYGGIEGLQRFHQERSSPVSDTARRRNKPPTKSTGDPARTEGVDTPMAERSDVSADAPDRLDETARAARGTPTRISKSAKSAERARENDEPRRPAIVQSSSYA